MGHHLEDLSSTLIEARILDLADGLAHTCECDDFEVEDGIVVHRCAWNDYVQLEAELAKRDMAVNR